MASENLRAGDEVFHRPTGETWVVAHTDADRDELSWCGWPDGIAKLSDCEVVSRATDEQHREVLARIAQSSGRRGDRARATLVALASGAGQGGGKGGA